MNTYTTGQFAKRVGVSPKTVQRWDREGRCVAGRTDSNRRYYTEEHVRQVLKLDPPVSQRSVVAYARVSSHAQKPDLKNQIKVLEEFCAARGFSGVEFTSEVGGGMNFRRKKLREIMRRVYARELSHLVIAHKDRLARFGFEHFEWVCSEHGCKVLVLNSETLSPQEEMVQDLMTIVHTFSARLYGLRNYKKELKKALK